MDNFPASIVDNFTLVVDNFDRVKKKLSEISVSYNLFFFFFILYRVIHDFEQSTDCQPVRTFRGEPFARVRYKIKPAQSTEKTVRTVFKIVDNSFIIRG